MNTLQETAIFIYRDGKIVGFITSDRACGAVVYSCERMSAPDIAELINPEHNVICKQLSGNGGASKAAGGAGQ